MKNKDRARGFVVICNKFHKIKKIVYKNIKLDKLKENNLLTKIIDENNMEKLLQLTFKINEQQASFGWEINVKTDNDIMTMNFSGIKYDGWLIIIAFCTNDEIINYYESLVKNENEYLNNIRNLIKFQLRKLSNIQQLKNNDDYNEISRLNNELTTLQRKLQKKNQKLEEQKKELQYYATTDRMTGLLNRRQGIKFLKKYMELNKRKGLPLTIAFVDINDLKEVNDNLGHKYGDELIKEVSNIMIKNVRAYDVVSRLGGDEFLVIFPECNKEGAREIWNRIRKHINKKNESADKLFTISVSYGLAEYNSSDKRDADELINIADKRMYERKNKYKKQKKYSGE